MAEIAVQRKGPGGWAWVLVILAVVLVGWGAIALMDRDDEVETAGFPSVMPPSDASPLAADASAPPVVAAFLTFAGAEAGAAGTPPIGVGHEYTAEGIRRLTAALKVFVDDGPEQAAARKQFAEFQEKADRIQADPEALTHANQVREAFSGAAAIMSSVQQDRWPDAKDLADQLNEVRTAAERVDATRPLLDQTAAVKGFFDRAAVAVRAMAQRS